MVMSSKGGLGEREGEAKNLLMKAWRERWTDVQWGIHVRSLVDPTSSSDGVFIANCILQQALGGPGPNQLVLSYLMHSVYSQVVTPCAVMQSICKYDGFHKPYCVLSLLDLLDNVKDRAILNDSEEREELVQSLASVTHWLLTCMYSSLEGLADLTAGDVPVDVEDSKIVTKCRNLLEFFLNDPFIGGLVYCAVLENAEMFTNIKKMSGEIAKFSEGRHQDDIAYITGLVDNIGRQTDKITSSRVNVNMRRQLLDGKRVMVGSPAIRCIIASIAISGTSIDDLAEVVTSLRTIKSLRGLTSAELFNEVIHASVACLVDSLGKQHELSVIGATFLVVPCLMKSLSSVLNASKDEFIMGVTQFVESDSTLCVADAKLKCYTLDLLLNKEGLMAEEDIKPLLDRKPKWSVPGEGSSSTNSPTVLLDVESTLLPILKALEGASDLKSNQESIMGVLLDTVGNTLNMLLTSACFTNRLKLFVMKLLKLNQESRNTSGEDVKSQSIRAVIFDMTFLVLCTIAQKYGSEILPLEQSEEYFFLDWYNQCMVVRNTVRDPDVILKRCNQEKVDELLNRCLQDESDLNKEACPLDDLCTNSVGVIKELLMAWEVDSTHFPNVKKALDALRSKMCALPICISAWLCSHIQVCPDEQTGKAKYALNHFLTPVKDMNDKENFSERHAIMSKLISEMMGCVQPSSSVTFSPTSSNSQDLILQSQPVSQLYRQCVDIMRTKGLLDVETMGSLKTLLDMSGADYFVQELVAELMVTSSAAELLQWSDILYGLFSINLTQCTSSLVRVVIPSYLHYSNRDSNFVEPQMSALISLTVDCIASLFLQTTMLDLEHEEERNEPLPKRRKAEEGNGTTDTQPVPLDLNFLLGEMFHELDKILKASRDTQPQAIFVLRFLEHLTITCPKLPMLNTLPRSIITNLMSLMSEDVTPELLINWHSLQEKAGRENCVFAICSLKHMRNISTHCSGGFN